MTVIVVLRDGREAHVASRLGETIADVLEALTAQTLTGSAVPLADALVELEGGEKVAYSRVQSWQEDSGFR